MAIGAQIVTYSATYFAFAFAGEAQQSVQEMLLEDGQARVSARWATMPAPMRFWRPRSRRAPPGADFGPIPILPLWRRKIGIACRASGAHFALVEGKVLSVHDSGGTIYVNFGQRWARDFSVIILHPDARSFAAAGLKPQALTGRRVRVRGWLEQRRGPIIEADAPEQIELIGAATGHSQEKR